MDIAIEKGADLKERFLGIITMKTNSVRDRKT